MQFLKNRLRKLKTFKDDKKALYFFTQTCEALNRWGYPVGLSFLEENFTPINPRLIFLVAFNSIFVLFNFYSVYSRKNEDMIEISLSCLTFGLALQGLVKQSTYYTNYRELKELIVSGTSVYDILQYKRIKVIARDFAFFGWMIVMHFIRYAYPIAVGFCFFVPIIYNYFLSAERSLPFSIEVPFLDYHTDVGYWINILYQCVSCIYVTIGLVASDGFYIVLLLNGFTQLENIFFELENLDILIEQKDVKNHSEMVSDHLENIIKLHQKYVRYLDVKTWIQTNDLIKKLNNIIPVTFDALMKFFSCYLL